MSNEDTINSLVQPSCLITADHKDIIQALSPYLHDVQNLGKIVDDYVGKPSLSTWQVGGKHLNLSKNPNLSGWKIWAQDCSSIGKRW